MCGKSAATVCFPEAENNRGSVEASLKVVIIQLFIQKNKVS
ncbi:hypothetical protein RCH33_1886 [Flavobacterium daejeonense]|nr:hypothetical protein RCH33_1886 [Flavobacterium daejeonense]